MQTMFTRPKRTKVSEESLKLIGIPRKFFDVELKDFNTYDTPCLIEVKDFVEEYLKQIASSHNSKGIKGVLFYGSNGVGKTMLSSMILKQAYLYRFTCSRLTFVDYMTLYTNTWDSSMSKDEKEYSRSVLNELKSRDFIVLEEVGKEVDGKASAPILEDLLRYREDSMLPIIICTNLPLSTLESRYGASIMSLLKGNTSPVKISEKDRR